MIIETKFDMFEMVNIVPLEGVVGRVMKITRDCSDLYYEVEYWHEGVVRVVTLMEFDMAQSVQVPHKQIKMAFENIKAPAHDTPF